MVYRKIFNRIIAASGATLMLGLISVGATTGHKVSASTSKVKNVIYLIGDGMSDTTISLARYFKDVQDGKVGNDKLAMDEVRVGFSKTSSLDSPITDSAAGGTALATGMKTNNGVVGLDGEGNPVANLLEASKEAGKLTGIVTSSHPTDATPGAFSSHHIDRNQESTIGKQQVHSKLDVYFGGDGKPEITEEMAAAEGYDIVKNKKELEDSKSNKLWGVFTKELDINREEFAPEQPSLAEMTKKAIEVLEKDEDGFALTVEGSKIDWEAHSQQSVGAATETLAFDEAIKVALDYAKDRDDTIVVITADHGTSGVSLGGDMTSTGYDSLTFEDSVMNFKGMKVNEGKFKSLIKGKSDDEIRKISKEYMNFDNLTDEEMVSLKNEDINGVIAQRVKLSYTTKKHTGGDVYLGSYVPNGVQNLSGTVDNANVGKFIEKTLGVNLQSTTEKLFDKNIKEKLEAEGAIVTIENEGIDIVAKAKKDNVTMTVYGNTDKIEVVKTEGKEEVEIENHITEGLNIIGDSTIYASNDVVEIFKKATTEESEKPEDGGDNEDGNKPGTDNNNPGDNSNTNKPNGNKPGVNKPNGKLPYTGALLGTTGILVLGSGFVGVGSMLAKKRKKND